MQRTHHTPEKNNQYSEEQLRFTEMHHGLEAMAVALARSGYIHVETAENTDQQAPQYDHAQTATYPLPGAEVSETPSFDVVDGMNYEDQ